jgi:uncharacterized SAM-binding protein YcdF (DUF218 family)
MFFILSKTLGTLTVPSHALTLLALIGAVLLLTRWRRAGRRILWFCLAVFLLVGFMPIGIALFFNLENRFPVWTETAGPPDGIIILGGPIRPYLSGARGQIALGEDAERFTEIPKLAKKYPNARIVFTGGNPRLIGKGTPEAFYAVQLLESFGIAPERIVAEERSRNTEENAAFTKDLVKPKPGERWLLVTSALHMPRAVGVFRKAGFPVEPYPVDWHSDGKPRAWWQWLIPGRSPIGGWGALDSASKEYVGLLVYWLTGRSSELFPAPEPPASPAAAGPADRRP